jgi:hypothetical protein
MNKSFAIKNLIGALAVKQAASCAHGLHCATVIQSARHAQ